MIRHCEMPGCYAESPGGGIVEDGKVLCLHHFERQPHLYTSPAYCGAFAEHDHRAWAHRIIARAKANMQINPVALSLASAAIHEIVTDFEPRHE